MPGRPVMAGVDVEVPQERETPVIAVVVVGIPDEDVHHAAVLARRRPGRVVLGQRRGRGDEVAIVEMVVVEFLVGPERRRISDQRAPTRVVSEYPRGLARR